MLQLRSFEFIQGERTCRISLLNEETLHLLMDGADIELTVDSCNPMEITSTVYEYLSQSGWDIPPLKEGYDDYDTLSSLLAQLYGCW